MAQVILPAAVLGLLWIISNQKKEGYSNLTKHPFRKQRPINYPIDIYKNKELTNNVRKYPNKKDSTKRYFEKEFQAEKLKEDYKDRGFQSLTGDKVNASKLQHNNMVPWFGSKVRQPLDSSRISENILDNYTGSGSQHNEKKVMAPLFKPQKNMHWAHGMPNNNDWLQERVNPSQKISGIKPFEDVKVAPGLNRGYDKEGYGGFNAGMTARDKWMPKNVDELRVKTNPKMTYNGQFLGPKAAVQNRGIQPHVEKQRPDTSWENSPDRWFTTTGLEKGPTSRAEEILRNENRSTTTREYYGPGQDATNAAIYANKNYQADNRQDLPTNPIGAATAKNVWNSDKNDYGKDGYVSLPNSRTLTGGNINMGNVARGMWAVVTPVLDALRPSRKSNIIGNMRPLGNASGSLQPKLYNRHQEPKSTIKEQHVKNNYIPMGMHAHDGGYATQDIQIKGQQRSSTQYQYIPNASGSAEYSRPQNYEAASNQRLNNKDLLSVSRTNMGNMKLVNNSMNVCSRKNPLINQQPFMTPKMPASAPTVTAMGQTSHKINRGQFTNHDRTEQSLINSLANNPYAKPFNSVA